MNKIPKHLLLIILLILSFLFIKNAEPAYARCDTEYCTELDCLDSRCDTCDFCLACDDQFCGVISDCTDQRCWGCPFCDVERCDIQFCTPEDCSEIRCADCDYCTNPPSPTPTPTIPSGTCTGATTGIQGRCVFSEIACPNPPLLLDGRSDDCNALLPFCCVDQCINYGECTGETTGRPGFCFRWFWDCPWGEPYDWQVDGYTCWGLVPRLCCVPPASCNLPVSLPTAVPTFLITPRPPLNPQVGCSLNEINTALGCVPFDNLTLFAEFFLKVAVGIGGGISFLLIVVSGFVYITSKGDPDKVQEAKQLLSASVAGLVFLLFSTFLLELAGIRILNLPGF